MSSKSKIVWITGAGTGIGRAITTEFIKNNSVVAVSSRKKDQLERLKKELTEFSKNYKIFPLDIRNSNDVNTTATEIKKKFEIDCLINNAGITSFDAAVDTSQEIAADIINTNLLGAIYTTQKVLPWMIENKKGTIINILSVAAFKIFTESSIYSASKAGLMAYSRVIREEVRDKNIRVVNIYPGATKTPIWPNEILEKKTEKMMSPADIARLIYNIYSEHSNMVAEEVTLRPISGDL